MGEACVVFVSFSVLFVTVAAYEVIVLPETFLIQRAFHSNLMLSCSSPDAPRGSQLLWYDNNGTEVRRTFPTSNYPGIWLDSLDNSVLKFQKLEKYFEGMYTCKLLINGEISKEVQRQLQLYLELAFSKAPNLQYLKLGESGLIFCEPMPNVDVSVKWIKDSVHLVEAERYKFNKSGLYVHNAEAADAGNYVCELKRDEPYSYVMEEVRVKILDTVNITKEIGNNIGIEGENFTLTCEASGELIKYKFFLNDVILNNESGVEVDELRGRVFFISLKRENGGNVTCSASNPVSVDNSTGNLTIHFPPSILSFPNRTFIKGSHISVKCLFDGQPSPSVNIKKVENDVSFDGGVLEIKSAAPEDAGLYTCDIMSPLGNDSATNIITIDFKPIVSPDQLLKWTTYVGVKRNLSCHVLAHPFPQFYWFLNSVELTDNATFQIFSNDCDSHLQIFLEENDQYWLFSMSTPRIKCVARNYVGELFVEIILERSLPPDQLSNISYVAYPCQIDFYVSLPETPADEPVLAIEVEILEETMTFPWGSHIKVRYLKQETTYEVGIRGVSDVGGGEYSFVDVTTLSPSAPYPITLISSMNSSSDISYLVKWEEPIDTCLPILQFQIKYRRISADPEPNNISKPLEEWIVSYENNGLAVSTNITDLRPDSYYQLEVLAQNDLGWSQAHGVFIFKTSLEQTKEAETILLVFGILLLCLLYMIIEAIFYITKRREFINYLLSRKESIASG